MGAPGKRGGLGVARLQCLITVVRYKSIDTTTGQLCTTRPGIDGTLGGLRRRCRLHVFRQSSANVVPARRKQRFVRRTRQILQRISQLSQDIRRRRRHYTRLQMVVPRTACTSCTTISCLRRTTSVRQLRVRVQRNNSVRTLSRILQRKCRLTLLQCTIRSSRRCARCYTQQNLGVRPVVSFRCDLLAGQSNPLTQGTVHSLSRLSGCVRVLRSSFRLPNRRNNSNIH